MFNNIFFSLICTKAIFISLSHHQQNSFYSKRNAREKKFFGGFQKRPLQLILVCFFLKSFGLILRLSCVVCVCLSMIHEGNTESVVAAILFARGRGLHTHLFFNLMLCLHSRNCFCLLHSYKIL